MTSRENVLELSEQDFSDFISKNKICIIDFYAEWCMPCVMMAPVVENLSSLNKKVKFAKINIDDAQEIANNYEVSSIPCLIFFKDGKEAGRIIGAVSEEVIENKIKQFF